MSPPRFYCPQLASSRSLPEARYLLDSAEAKHATSVLRLRVDDAIALFDGQGVSALAKVIEAKRDRMFVEVTEWLAPAVVSLAELTLAIALPKGDRQKTLVDAATELGVARLVPIFSDRGVAQPTESALERLRRQVIEACKQCGRTQLMQISDPCTLSELKDTCTDNSKLRLVAHPYDVTGPRQHLTAHLQGDVCSSMLVVGPEGGFTDSEVQLLSDDGWSVVDLGPLVLRIEIAAIAAISQIVGWYYAHESKSIP